MDGTGAKLLCCSELNVLIGLHPLHDLLPENGRRNARKQGLPFA
jgi:hypothetical protein